RGADDADRLVQRRGRVREGCRGGIATIGEAGEEQVEAALAVGLAAELGAQAGIDAGLHRRGNQAPVGDGSVVREEPGTPLERMGIHERDRPDARLAQVREDGRGGDEGADVLEILVTVGSGKAAHHLRHPAHVPAEPPPVGMLAALDAERVGAVEQLVRDGARGDGAAAEEPAHAAILAPPALPGSVSTAGSFARKPVEPSTPCYGPARCARARPSWRSFSRSLAGRPPALPIRITRRQGASTISCMCRSSTTPTAIRRWIRWPASWRRSTTTPWTRPPPKRSSEPSSAVARSSPSRGPSARRCRRRPRT